jgi:hypothetical protein
MVVRRQGSHIFYTVGSQMAVRLSALRVGRALPPGRFLILTTLFKKYLTLFFPGKTSDGRLANLITVVGRTFIHMPDLFAASPGVSFSPRQLVCEVL